MTGLPYEPRVCRKCLEEGNQNGRLVFKNETVTPTCRYHKTPLEAPSERSAIRRVALPG